MKRLLLPLLAALALPTAVNAEIDPKIRKACLRAADFEGCVNAYTNPKEKNKKLDFLGMEPLKGHMAIESQPDRTIIYYDENTIKKVKVRGLFGRYFIYTLIARWYRDYVPGRAGSSTTIGTGTTNCYGYGSSLSCTTTPPTTINIPGRAPIPSGVVQEKATVIVDCLDRKAKMIALNWKTYKNKKWRSFEGQIATQPIADEYCSKIESLQASNYLKMEKGKPNKQDFLALEILPGSKPQDIRNAVKSKKGIKGINCKSPVWKNKPICN